MKGKIFNAQEVQAIIAGNKTIFREVIKPQLPEYKEAIMFNEKAFFAVHDRPVQFVKCPYKVGQKIFVKEKWGIGSRPDQFGGYKGFEYEADCFGDNENLPCYEIDYDKLPKNIEIDNWIGNWEQARLMPQWASRITLLIKEIRVEKLIPITQEDCVAEGVKFGYEETNWGATKAFKDNWNATHKKPEEKFEVNPFVWVVDFKINK